MLVGQVGSLEQGGEKSFVGKIEPYTLLLLLLIAFFFFPKSLLYILFESLLVKIKLL